jgi:hypothetical protein
MTTFVIAYNKARAQAHFDRFGMQMPEDAIICTSRLDTQDRRIDPGKDKVVWVDNGPAFDRMWYDLTIHLSEEEARQLRFQV